MPTGYTDAIRNGKITEFKDYALSCARNFGALITMRNQPADAKIPDSFEVAEHYTERVSQAQANLDTFDHCSDELLRVRQESEYKNSCENTAKRLTEMRLGRSRYEDMLDKVENYEPPTEGHVNYKEFMIRQLEDSIDADCNEEYCKTPAMVDFDEWKTVKRKSLQDDLDYTKKSLVEEAQRVAGRSKWISDLKKSLE